MTSSSDVAADPDTDPATAAALAAAQRWVTAAMLGGGLSMLLLPLLGCLLLVTMGLGMFLFPVLIPGFLFGCLCALRAKRIEASVGASRSETRLALNLNLGGLVASGVLSAIAGGVALIAYFGR